MSTGSHHSNDDARNEHIQININGELFLRHEAKISVFDSGFILGDGVWEGLRLHHGKLPFIDQHLKRLYEGAKALDLDIGLTPEELKTRVMDTCRANGMEDDVHIRLMVSRGVKSTPYQDPRVTITPATIVIIPEYKIPSPDTANRGLNLYTVYVRRGYPDVQDPKLNSHSKLNCIFGCIQATKAGADEALMLDPHGFVSTCNSTHFFIVRDGEVWTSTGDYCLAGITRSNIIKLCKLAHIPVYEKNFSLAEVYGADEAFVTGTFAGVTPVKTVDGRDIGDYPTRESKGPMVHRLQQLYTQMIANECHSSLFEA
ncbi:aminotransferase class IV [Thalassotalea sp. PS06]|uniref:aminotransferase class IV n=1 Tax=Thalassotalea sp. PS06 TaxID=2594005 RepID=UPI001163FEC9|nr:aminotransferase class IV [Thalassotalea sp. PS06]QDP02736.1 aminotransferase class IV [Thalassotalea sp. PS06]